MIVKIIPVTNTNITLQYASKEYLCYNRQDAPGGAFQIGSASITPTSTSDSSFVNEVEVIIDDQEPPIIDENGNVYFAVNRYRENLGTTQPARV